MKTIGQYLRAARKAKKMSISELAEKTKIRRDFLVAIEKERWRALPEFTVVSGFVKNIADSVGMNKQQAVALLRRDYPPADKKTQQTDTLPKKEIESEFRWSPRLTFFAGVGAIILAVAVYLIVQYITFVRPPNLMVSSPEENQVVLARELAVSGKTDPNTSVVVNTQPALVADTGEFHTRIDIDESVTTIEVRAVSRAGKETIITRTIRPELAN